MKDKILRCANCGRKLDEVKRRNIDGEQCCEACWLAEEDKLKNY